MDCLSEDGGRFLWLSRFAQRPSPMQSSFCTEGGRQIVFQADGLAATLQAFNASIIIIKKSCLWYNDVESIHVKDDVPVAWQCEGNKSKQHSAPL